MPFEITFSEGPISPRQHASIYYEMLYVQEGQVKMTIHDNAHFIHSGDMVFLNQFDTHTTVILRKPYKRYYLLIPPTQLKAFHNDVFLLSVFRHGANFPYVLSSGKDKPCFDSFFQILLEVASQGRAYVDEQIEAVMTLILTQAHSIRPDMFRTQADTSFLPIQDILDELDQNFSHEFSLGSLSQKYHVSPGCLSHHFKEQVGLSPMQFVTLRRLTHAQLLLLKTELSVQEIALRCGFNDVSNFIRRFRQQYGEPPLQFRRSEQRAPGELRIRYITGTTV